MADTNVRPAGSRSCTATFVAALGPRFDTVTVQVKFAPMPGVAVLAITVSARSACCGVAVALAPLLAGLGSDWSECETVAVLVWALGLTTVAWICNVCGVDVVTVPTVQTPVPLA